MSQKNANDPFLGTTVNLSVTAWGAIKEFDRGQGVQGVISVNDGKNNYSVFVSDSKTIETLKSVTKGTPLNISGVLNKVKEPDANNNKAQLIVNAFHVMVGNTPNASFLNNMVTVRSFAWDAIYEFDRGQGRQGVVKVNDGKNNYSVFVKDERTLDFLKKNAHRGTRFVITGSLSTIKAPEAGSNYATNLSLTAYNIEVVGNFGERYVQDRVNGTTTANSQQQSQQQPQQQAQQTQQVPVNNEPPVYEPPMDFDDDIPF